MVAPKANPAVGWLFFFFFITQESSGLLKGALIHHPYGLATT